jgi:hypothetical protein
VPEARGWKKFKEDKYMCRGEIKKIGKIRLFVFVMVLSFAFIGYLNCTKQNPFDSINIMGNLKILLTDAPFPIEQVKEANVTISKIEARNQTIETYPFIILNEESKTFNLLELRNGVTAELINLEVPTGFYDLIRLYVDNAEIVLKDEQVFNLKVPSGAQTGIKIFISPEIEVASSLTAELILDFDLSQSFVVQGNPNTPAGINGFIFKPVIRAENISTAGTLSGTVTDGTDVSNIIPLEGVLITVKQNDVEIASAITESDGSYKFLALAAGDYKVIATLELYQTFEQENVQVTSGNLTTLDIQMTK